MSFDGGKLGCEFATSSRSRRKSKWDKKFEEKVPKGGFLDWTLALLMLSAFGCFVWYNRHGQTPTNHAKSADEVAAERAVEMQNKAIQERKRRRKR